ncbi:uncharacterized protein LTR77_010180 [Saxophila tyrrhenica]|uniref:Tyrosine specific protein phosphatases domain-containing protein n=1 Tax=Saxophila tyrrhenica TaxID=1690608 RepID=A0AAV9NW50_9PEZI|nr:hypothetical protein LTR77_010180 [Saxophila tyrrhenica]
MATPEPQRDTSEPIRPEGILNFRDAATLPNSTSARNILKPNLLYRSARPDAATPSDHGTLTQTLSIKTILDLRTPTEHLDQARALPAPPGTTTSTSSEPPGRIPGIRYVDINFNGSTYTRALLSQLPYFSTARLAFWYSLGYRKYAISILAAAVMAPRGLVGLAEDSLRYCRAEVAEVFSLLASESSEGGKGVYPLLIHCTQGKDRTGLIVLLILLLLGVPVSAIEADYQASGPELAKERQAKVEEVRSIGLPDAFADCEDGWAGGVCGFIEREFGGVEGYLEGCGVTGEQMERIKKTLKAT